MTEKEKENLIIRLSDENYLPDGYERMNPGDIDNLYVKKQYGGDLEMTNLEGMFDYWLNNYDNGKSLKTQSKEQAFEAFKNAYLKAVIEN